MSIRYLFGLAVLAITLSFCLESAQAANQIQQFFNDGARDVKSVPVPAMKRAILDHEFQAVDSALRAVQSMPTVSLSDRAAIERYKAIVQDKRDELNGANGFIQISDAQLDSFSNYVVQDMEQADTIVTMSFVTLLLIILLIVLIVR